MWFIRFIVLILIIVGALNWGLWGFFKYDLIAYIFNGNETGWARVCYAFIGLGGIYSLSFLFNTCIYKGRCSCRQKEPKE